MNTAHFLSLQNTPVCISPGEDVTFCELTLELGFLILFEHIWIDKDIRDALQLLHRP
jgi:hypothetical protein